MKYDFLQGAWWQFCFYFSGIFPSPTQEERGTSEELGLWFSLHWFGWEDLCACPLEPGNWQTSLGSSDGALPQESGYELGGRGCSAKNSPSCGYLTPYSV